MLLIECSELFYYYLFLETVFFFLPTPVRFVLDPIGSHSQCNPLKEGTEFSLIHLSRLICHNRIKGRILP